MIVNLTPHEITCALTGRTFPPSGQVARVDSWYAPFSERGGIPLFRQFFGEVIGLPEEREDTLLIVSAMVRERAEDRDDLVSPGELVRNAAGQPIGCKGFVIATRHQPKPVSEAVAESIAESIATNSNSIVSATVAAVKGKSPDEALAAAMSDASLTDWDANLADDGTFDVIGTDDEKKYHINVTVARFTPTNQTP